jgi:pimeloyl-ACP methyl ester carboxylesterase
MDDHVWSGDGVRVQSVGAGPGLVVVHGGGVTIGSYRRLADRLSDRFTVHLYNRRGRADAPPRQGPYDVREDVHDLGTVLDRTGAVHVLGHSGGAFVALTAAALQLPIERLALYDPAISVDGLFPAGWLDSARTAARQGDTARAMALTSAGINTHSPVSTLPMVVQVGICRLFLRTPLGRSMGELLPMTLDESHAIWLADGPAARWAGVTADVLLVRGTAGPPYYEQINNALAAALPRARTLAVRCGHDGINRAPARLVDPLAAFFGATEPTP